jgi:GNAT superfamily N-acetyltransferase
MEKLSDEQARYFASTDGVDHFGLVALDPEDPEEIIAVVRYARKPGDQRAEYAALVEDSWQGQGVGTALTHRLINEARGNRVRSFYALVKGANVCSTFCGTSIFPNKSEWKTERRWWRLGCRPKKPNERGKR